MGRRIIRLAMLLAIVAAVFPAAAHAGYFSDPAPTFSQIGGDSWQSFKDLDNRSWGYVPAGADVFYTWETGTYTAFAIPSDVFPVQAAELRLVGALDDHYPGAPWGWVSPYPRKIQLRVNGVAVAAESTWNWGSPFGGVFTNLSTWTAVVDPALLQAQNTVEVYENDPAASYGDWVVVDSIALVVTRWPAEATVDVDPDTLNAKSKGGDDSVTAYAELPAGFSASDVVPSSVTLSFSGGTLTATRLAGSTDLDGDGRVEVAIKFDRQTLVALVSNGDVAVTLQGTLAGGQRFSGTDTIRVINAD